jgi:hypothetical protein
MREHVKILGILNIVMGSLVGAGGLFVLLATGGIIVSGLSLLHFPLGTALGIYGLWVLLNEQSRQLLESGGTLPPPTFSMQQPAGFPTGRPPQGF